MKPIYVKAQDFLFLLIFFLFSYISDAQVSFEANGQQINNLLGNDAELGDFNNDGYLDVFVVNSNSRDGVGHRVYLNDGEGQFTDNGQQLYDSTFIDMNAAIGDINGDGKLEVITGTTVWLNNGSGIFEPADEKIELSDTSGLLGVVVKLADLNNDSYLDLFCVIVDANNSNVRIYFNDGNGKFQNTGQKFGGGTIAKAELADLDGDGDIDAVTAGWKPNSMDPSGSNYCPNRIWLNDGSGNFTEGAQILDEGTRHIHGIRIADINGDEKPDLVIGLTSSPFMKIFTNDGSGNFTTGQTFGNIWVSGFALGDINNDGTPDVMIVSGDCSVLPRAVAGQVWLNDGTGHYTDSKFRLASDISSDVELSDFNGDSKPDAFVVNWGWDNAAYAQVGSPSTIYLNNTTETSVKLSDTPDKLLEVYPNPCHDKVTVRFNNPIRNFLSLEVTDMQGRCILTTNLSGDNDTTIDLNGLVKGAYLLTLKINNNTIARKICIE